MPVVGAREPCPCGSGRRYKACHGRGGGDDRALVTRPFAGRVDETEWVALREIVPAATAPLTVTGAPDRTVLLATVLPMAWPALVRGDGSILLGLQVPARSGDVSRDLGAALEEALAADPGTAISPAGGGARLQELLDPAPIEVTLHPGFDFWLDPATEPTADVAASLERANSAVVPTERLGSVRSAYWCRMPERSHLRWVMPYDEEPLLDGLARLAGTGRPGEGLSLGEGTRYVGSFRAHGVLVPVWDLPRDTPAAAYEEPAQALEARIVEAVADPTPLTEAQRRARSGLMSRQLTLR